MSERLQSLNGFAFSVDKKRIRTYAIKRGADEARNTYSDFVMPEVDGMMNYVVTARLKAQELKTISPNSTLSPALNTYPSVWIDAICREFRISTSVKKRKENQSVVEYFKDRIRHKLGKRREKIQGIVEYLTDKKRLASVVGKLPKASKDALRFVSEQGGCVEVEQVKSFRTILEDGWYWANKPPKSPIGRLRVRGLFFVGNAGESGEPHTVAVIPEELRQPLREILAA
ncbi:MAG: hypothetical protein H8D26_06335 [Methanomicrobia archaeon]|nr:hypothetical protein [Methanomicrobia archaeon]